jgi:electron transfer flavoprotein beta subunit
MLKEIVNSAGDCWQVKASLEDGHRLLEVDLPALFTVTRDLNEPRALSFSGIIKARKKEITVWGKEDLGVPEELLGLPGSPTIVSDMTTTDNKRKVEILTGSREEMADQLLTKLVDAGAI